MFLFYKLIAGLQFLLWLRFYVSDHHIEIDGGDFPEKVAQAFAACKPLSDAQRIALAILLVRQVSDPHCKLQLNRLATISTERAFEL